MIDIYYIICFIAFNIINEAILAHDTFKSYNIILTKMVKSIYTAVKDTRRLTH
ncbi:MAG: hypothetical protein JWR50_4234 [Mucilaginibacter sp.]|nr:hypothetical protein [Mucilaginibacter sp.]